MAIDRVDVSRRGFLTSGAVGLAGPLGAVACRTSAGGPAPPAANPTPPAGLRSATPANLQNLVGDGRKRRILLRGGVVLSLDPKVGDFARADVLVDGKTIAAIAPEIAAGDAEVIDCAGTIVMPGFITTHNHQYEAILRSLIPDGILAGAWPLETYGSVVQNIWTAGRIVAPDDPNRVIWDLGRVPYDPEDCYIAQLVSCLSQITEGVTCGTDTSQANHTPAHTDAMITGMMDSGRRMVFDYSGGIDRSADGFPYEVPGAMNDTTRGVGRIATRYFSSKDQLLTLGFGGGPGPAFPGAPYTGWQLGRSFGALINNHNVGNAKGVIDAAADPRNGGDWSDVTFVHGTRWQDESYAQLGSGSAAYPAAGRSRAWDIVRDRGAHVSIAVLIEMQMRHGTPPLQEALNHGILPSLSPDVDTNMTTDPFSLMRGAYCLQRALANELAFRESNPGNLPVPQLVTSRQVVEMATIAGAAANRLQDKIGTLTPGKEADIVVLEARSVNTWPMNNVPGTVVTMMNPRHVRDVLIAGRVVYWKRALVGWDVDRLLRQAEQARDRVLARINGPAKIGALPAGNNSGGNPYRPNLLGDCCHKGTNTAAPEYALRP
ncbi:MAG: amidohydrolase family protein [Acidobacteria bacterium]|nr:amidohydrolase family protein [Acidobacteriota bacterium]